MKITTPILNRKARSPQGAVPPGSAIAKRCFVFPGAPALYLFVWFQLTFHGCGELEKARTRIEALIPGDGPLEARVEALRKSFRIPPEKLAGVLEASIAELKKRTAERVKLPVGERFQLGLVSGESWAS